MQRTIPKAQAIDIRHRTIPSEAPKHNDRVALTRLLTCGFSGAQSYSEMNRDRYYPVLCEGVGIERLLAFCSNHLSGSPIPDGREVFMHGRILLNMFKAAQKEGLVLLNHVRAECFVPELR